MYCTHCGQLLPRPERVCPRCGYNDDAGLRAELAHVRWLRREIESWAGVIPRDRIYLAQRYAARQRDLEVALGLRPPPFEPEEARRAWPGLHHRQAFLTLLRGWQAAGLVDPAAAAAVAGELEGEVHDLDLRLEGHAPPAATETPAARLARLAYCLEAAGQLEARGGFASPEAAAEAHRPLLAERQALERGLGILRPQPVAAAAVPAAPAILPGVELPTARPAARVPQPRLPLRDRLWRTLLSERTLQVMLFLGIFLLFAAAISFVVWGWQGFSPGMRMAIPAAFTALFFGLGWAVRRWTHLYRSGLALTAIAALLIPVDGYTIYVNLHVPADRAPLFWLLTSIACLAAYLLTALLTQSGVFGYLVGAAAGSATLALVAMAHQGFGLSLDWRSAAISVLAAGLTWLAGRLDDRVRSKAWHVLADPLGRLALLAVATVMLLSLGWRYAERHTYDTLHYAMTANWAVGALLLARGALQHRSRSLALLAGLALPVAVYMGQAGLLDRYRTSPAWHAPGLAALVPLYVAIAHRLWAQREDAICQALGRTAAGCALALGAASALWPLVDLGAGAPAASSHAILAGAAVLAAYLWRRPRLAYLGSLLSVTSLTAAMTEMHLALSHLAIGYASLAIVHILAALRLGGGPSEDRAEPLAALPRELALCLVVAGLAVAALSFLPPLLPYDGRILAYALGNWLGLAAWCALLAHRRQPGFGPSPGARLAFHWMVALPLPLWVWLLFANRGPLDAGLPLTLASLAWGLVALGTALGRLEAAYRRPWHVAGLLVSAAAPVVAFALVPGGTVPAICLLAAGLLYVADALYSRQPVEVAAGGLVVAWGLDLLLQRRGLASGPLILAVAALAAVYILAGLWARERRLPGATADVLRFWYWAAHAVALAALCRTMVPPVEDLLAGVPWTAAAQLWGGATQLLLGAIYGLYAWAYYRERWAHVAAWLLVGGWGFVAIRYTGGRGSLTICAALGAGAYVLAERGLYRLWRRPGERRRRALARLIWRLTRRPLLLAGWSASALAIGLALIRNLALLGGRTAQVRAACGLLLVTGLYALSARLFRRARFAWLACLLVPVPWTILTHLGWLLWPRPAAPTHAIAWAGLAWLLCLVGLILRRAHLRAYSLAPRVLAHIFLPFALLWGIAHAETSRITFGLAIALYGLEAALDYRQARAATGPTTGAAWRTGFLYPALGLIPVWAVYLLGWLAPSARHEHYGLLLVAMGPLGMLVGRRLERLAPPAAASTRYGLPAYLTGYVSALVGTLLLAHVQPLLAGVLLFDALLMLASARLFRQPLWTYPAAALVPLSLLLALDHWGVPANRHGWWLTGLAALYLLAAWALRRAQRPAYATAALMAGFGLIALGLPPSSGDRTGAFWGYGAAALLYGVSALWLGQPLLLVPAGGLAVVPYGVALRQLAVPAQYHGLALFPGALGALLGACWLDARRGAWQGFPWAQPSRWAAALADQVFHWWGLPLYGVGFGLAAASPFFAAGRAGLVALNWLLLVPVCAWATWRFRLRGWLLAAGLAGHLAAGFYLQALGWWRHPAEAWLRFLPVTLLTAALGLLAERRRQEGSPLDLRRCLTGWSRPLYGLVLLDLLAGQAWSLGSTEAGALVTLAHALLLAVLASCWQARELPFAGAALGAVALAQWLAAAGTRALGWPVPLARLALAYGLGGYGLALLRERQYQGLTPGLAIWERPLRRLSTGLSLGILVLAACLGPDLVRWTARALLGLPFRPLADLQTVQMVVGVLALLGLLYVAAAYIHRRLRLGYVAIGMLLGAWVLHVFYVRQWSGPAQVQWYAVPAGIYLLGIGHLEHGRGNQALARWLDYAAVVLLMGSLFWQTVLLGWRYALMLGAEGFLALWWGSARRLRRFLYAGMMGVILATVAQLINSLRSVNQWIVFGVIGLLVVTAAIVVERKLEEIKAWRQVLESWE